jgi:hypothetical protein
MNDLYANLLALCVTHDARQQTTVAGDLKRLYESASHLANGSPAADYSDEAWVIAGAVDGALDPEAPEQQEMTDWLARFIDCYIQMMAYRLELKEELDLGGNPHADVSAEHGAMASLLSESLDL